RVAYDSTVGHAACAVHHDLVVAPVRPDLADDPGRADRRDQHTRHRAVSARVRLSRPRTGRRRGHGGTLDRDPGHDGLFPVDAARRTREGTAMIRRADWGHGLRMLAILALLGAAAFPLYWMFVTSMTPSSELFAPVARLVPNP